MNNWIGQNIDVGSVVWRGARQGNTSSFKVGQVERVNEQKGVARVRWLFEPGYSWRYSRLDQADKDRLPNVRRTESVGSPSIDTLVVIDLDLEELGYKADELKMLLDSLPPR